MNPNIAEWEALANTEADALRSALGSMAFDDLRLSLVPEEEANGHNSMDEGFLKSLQRGEHLTDAFLSGV